MLVRKIKYKNGREIYRRTSFLDKVKYYEDLIYSIVFAFGLVPPGCGAIGRLYF